MHFKKIQEIKKTEPVIVTNVYQEIYLTDFSSTATGAKILFRFVSMICPFMIISSRIMWALSMLNMIY